MIKNLQAPPELTSAQARSVKLKSSRYCILNDYLYWKDPGGILLNCLLETEVKEKINEFHKKHCGGHLYWKSTSNKILKAGYYWPTLFSNVYAKIKACIPCQKFEGKQKLLPLPLIPIFVETPF